MTRHVSRRLKNYATSKVETKTKTMIINICTRSFYVETDDGKQFDTSTLSERKY